MNLRIIGMIQINFGTWKEIKMTDKDLNERIKHLTEWLKKVKPKDHKNRGWEDSRWIMLETIKELERRSNYMDFIQMKWTQEQFEKHVEEKALVTIKRDKNGKVIPIKFTEEETDTLIKLTVEQFRSNPVQKSWRK
tara:strand:+ start:121 stop:528 length:408 start_codon:yes stop_codon:yes gene_type:complete